MTTQLAFLVPSDVDQADPNAAHRAVVRDAIETTAALHSGYVSPNAVRVRLTGTGVPGHIVGQVYRALRLAGHLVACSTERSDDTRGGNAGRLIETYTWVERPS